MSVGVVVVGLGVYDAVEVEVGLFGVIYSEAVLNV